MEKIKKIIIIALLSASIMGNSIYYCYADTLSATVDLGGGLAAMSAGGTAAALVSVEAALPFILCALGIAGFAYIAGKANLITTIYNQVKEGTQDFCYEVKDAHGITQRYFKSLYCKGKNYIEESYLEVIAAIGLQEGLFDGTYVGSYDIDTFPSTFTTQPIEIQGSLSLGQLESFIASKTIDSDFKNQMSVGISGIFAKYPALSNYNGYSLTCMKNNYVGVTAYNLDYPYTTTFEYSDGMIRSTAMKKGQAAFIYYNSGTAYYFSDTYQYLEIGWTEGTGADKYITASGLNGEAGELEGIPITDNIPVEENGAISLPIWDNPALTGEDALPVTIPIGYEYPCVWDPELVADPVMPDILDPDLDWSYPLPLEDNPSFPQDEAQPVSQEGDVTDTPAIDYPYYPQNDTFMLPDTIKTKFPFCVPFDMVQCVRSLSTNRAAPHYEWNYDIAGMTGTAVIDLSRFDSAAEVLRRCELVAFVIGLIAGTKSLLGDRSG